MTESDIVIVGAGIAGLTCAQQLVQAGESVVVLEKSRGVGGRVATRRVPHARVDHGTCYLSPGGDRRFQAWMQQLIERGILQVWTDTVHEVDVAGQLHTPPVTDRYPRYTAPEGMSAIAKTLATGLTIRFCHRVQRIALTHDRHWQLTLDNPFEPHATLSSLSAKRLILAIPAPQAVTLLEPVANLSREFIQQLAAVQFLPCLSVMAGYTAEQEQAWQSCYPDLNAATFINHPALGWLGFDSSKRVRPAPPIFVLQSSAAFAEQYLDDTDLQPAGVALLQQAAEQFAPWLAHPEWMQVHRWRYAFAKTPLADTYLVATTDPLLVCTGDWCLGRKVEQAYTAGLATAAWVRSQTKTP